MLNGPRTWDHDIYPLRSLEPYNPSLDLGSLTRPWRNIYFSGSAIGPAFDLSNNQYLQARNAANTGYVGLIKADTSDNTVVNAITGKAINFDINSVTKLALNTTGDLVFSNTISNIMTDTVDGTDNKILHIAGGGASDITGIRGAEVSVAGNEVATFGGRAAIYGGAVATGAIRLKLNHATPTVFVENVAGLTNFSINDAGTTTSRGVYTWSTANSGFIGAPTSTVFQNNANSAQNLSIADTGSLTISRGALVFGAAASQIVPGVTSLSFRNNANSADNVTVTDAGVVTIARNNLVLSTSLSFTQAAAVIFPGVTSLTFKNSAGSANNLAIVDAGDITVSRGSLTIATAGKSLVVQSGSNAKSGTVIANGASNVTVSTTAITTNSAVVFGLKTVGGTPAPVFQSTITAGTSFTIQSTAGNTSTYNWIIFDLA